MAAIGLIAAALSARAQWESDDSRTTAADLLPAQQVLANLRASFPPQPLLVVAQLIRADADGRDRQTLNARLVLDWNAAVPSARFIIEDAFGTPLDRLTVRRPPAASPQYTYEKGDPPIEQPIPPMASAVEGTDFSWADLTLSFLWWPGGETTELAMKKGRECYLVRLPAPVQGGPYAEVRLWVDRHVFALLQADGYDADGRVVKRLAVKSLKKVEGVWTLQDLEVRSFPGGERTTLRVLESRMLPVEGAAPAPAASAADQPAEDTAP